MAKVMVTGGTGYVGGAVVGHLRAAGHEVAVLSRSAGVDILDGDAVRAAMESVRPDVVVHAAALANPARSWKAPLDFYRANGLGTGNVLQAMVGAGVKKVVLVSTVKVYGSGGELREDMPCAPASPYARSKHVSELMVQDAAVAHGLEATILRLGNVVGGAMDEANPHNLFGVILAVLAGKKPFLPLMGVDFDTPDGTALNDFVHVGDVARAVGAAVEKPAAGVVNVGSGVGVSVREVVKMFEEVRRVSMPVQEAPARQGDAAMTVMDVQKAKTALGWEAAADLRRMVEESVGKEE